MKTVAEPAQHHPGTRPLAGPGCPEPRVPLPFQRPRGTLLPSCYLSVAPVLSRILFLPAAFLRFHVCPKLMALENLGVELIPKQQLA